MVKKLSIFQFLVFSLIVLFSTPTIVSADSITVVASDQDYDIAKLVSDSLDARLVVTQWGTLTTEDVQRITEGASETLIIIGGPYAVPKSAEELGIISERVGGGDRIETARLALERFFQVKARSYVLPSKDVVREYFLDSGDKSAVFLVGNSTISERWGRYYSTKLGLYFKDVSVFPLESDKIPDISEVQTIIAIGNVDNNPFISQKWPSSLPPELTYFPLVYLKDSEETDTLFIVGSDQNIYYTQKATEDMGLKKLLARDFLMFLLLIALMIFSVHRSNKSLFTLPVLIATGIGFVLLEMRRLPQSYLTWDSLYVYFDGALSLSFLDKYETILSGRSSPGTSYITHLYFRLTSPTDINAILLTMLLALAILFLGYVIGSDLLNKKNGIAVMFILYSNPYFRDRIPIYASEIPFAFFTLITLILLSSNSSRKVGLGGLFITLSSYIRPSGLLLYPAAVTYLLYSKRLREAGTITAVFIASLVALQVVVPSVAVIGAYSSEMSVKGQYQIQSTDLIVSIKDVLYYFVLMLGVGLLPGLRIRKDSKEFERIASIYVLLHLVSLSFWVSLTARYVFPVIPIATIIVVTRINDMKGHVLKRVILTVAVGINLYMMFTGYRFPNIV